MRRNGLALLLAFLLAACAGPRPVPPAEPVPAPPRVDESQVLPVLGYYQLLARMSPQELGRERIVLAALPPSPAVQVRMAMLAAHPRGQADVSKALTLLEAVLKSSEPMAVGLHPLARLLADQLGERQKLEKLADTANQQLKDTQRRAGELQEKLDALTDIERSLPARPRAGGAAGTGGGGGR